MSFERKSSPRKGGPSKSGRPSRGSSERRPSGRVTSGRGYFRDDQAGRARRDSKDERPGTKGRADSERSDRPARKKFEKRPRIDRGPWENTAYEVSKGATAIATTAAEPSADGRERLQKVLARCGVASRRKAELLILEGAITVNGRPVVELGTKVDPKSDKIKVNGKLIYTEVEPIFIALYKPKGMISAMSDPEGRRTIGHIVSSIRERVIPVGRLDYNSEGLMLLTNDGNLAEKILKAREMPKVYMVKIKGHPKEEDLDFLKRGFFSAGGVVRFASFGVEQSLKSKSWLKLEVTEGSQLDLRELLNHKGLLVDRIVRTAIGTISIKGLKPGEYRFLKRSDFEKLFS